MDLRSSYNMDNAILIKRINSTMFHRLRAILLGCLLALAPLLAAADVANFLFTDTQGKTYRLSDLKGKWVLVNFWTPWCPPCWMELPDLNQLQHEHADLVVIGVAMDYLREDSVQYVVEKHKIDFPVVMGGKSRARDNVSKQVGPVPFYPTSYLYGPDSQVALVKSGVIDREEIEDVLASHPHAAPKQL